MPDAWVWILPLLFINCVSLGEFLTEFLCALAYLFENEDDDSNTGHLTKQWK